MAGAVSASLGDNSDRIEDAYGNLVRRRLFDDGKVGILYHKDHYLFYVIFDQDVSISERYSYYEQRDLSEKEIARFLKANAGRKIDDRIMLTVNART